MVEAWRLADPKYVDFDPDNVQQAILKFRRLQEMGLSPWKYPEAMVECCKKLPDAEIDKFESWIVNPAGEPDADAVDVRDFLKAQADLDVKHGRDAMAPLLEQDDEKTNDITSSDEEKEVN